MKFQHSKVKLYFKNALPYKKYLFFFCFLSNNKDLSKYNQIRNLQRLWTDSVLVLCIAFDYFFIINVGLIDKLTNIIETHAAILKSTHFFPILKETMAIHPKKAQSYYQYFFNNVYFLIFNFNPTPVLQFLYNAKQNYDWRVILLTI